MSASALTQTTRSGKHTNKADAMLEVLVDFPTLFSRQLARTPDHVSMVFEGKSYRYKDLDELSEQFKLSILCHKTQASLNGPVMCVGICVDKSPEAIAAMLGVLKAGAAFVPLDPGYPIDHIAFMIEDAGISTVIAQSNHQEKIAAFLAEQLVDKNTDIHWISSESPAKNTDSETMLNRMIVDIKPSDLAYIMYISDSTGKPKGVQIEHAALTTHCYADIERMYKTGDLSRWLPSGEIEAAINHHPNVLESLVSYAEVNGKKSLISYIAIGQKAFEQETICAKNICDFLENKLLPFMIPAGYIFVASFPKTTNGKIDLKALPDAIESSSAEESDQDSIELRKRLPQLQSVYLARGEERLFSMHYRPQEGQKSQSHAVLICHPLGHEYSRAYRNLQQFSLHLSQAGFDVFRFDYSGTGNSSGSSDTALVSDYIEDIKTSADYIREQSQCQKLSIIGLRMGALLAVSAEIADIENLILWDPIVNSANYIELLQGFHDKALSKHERFRKLRKPSDPLQLYGYAMSQAQRNSLISLTMPHLDAVGVGKRGTKTQTMITSSAYQRNEPGRLDLIDNCQHYATQDEIQWHDQRYADSAFSSPEAFKIIMNVLTGEPA